MLQSDCNTKNWEFITGWFKENHGLIRKIFIGYGWSTDYEFEDFEQQAMVLAAGIINKTGNISDCAFKKELLWALRSHLWQNRTKVRVSDVDEFQPDNNNPVRMLDYHEVEDFMFFNTDAGQEAGKIFDYELLHAILGLVSVRESEIVSAYFGLSEDVSLTSMKMSEVAEHFKISESAVSQLIKKFKNKVNEVFKEKGVKSSSSKEEILNAISEHNRIKAANVKEFVMSDIKIVNVESIKTSEPFISLFPVSDPVLHKVAKSMSKSGYDKSQPLIIWKDRDVLIDGHTRLQAAQLAVLDKVPVVEISFESEEEVIEYLFNLQFNRRNVKEYGLIKLAERIFKGVDDTNTDKSTFLTGLFSDISTVKAKKLITVLENADNKQLEDIRNESATISSIYLQIRDKNKLMSQDAELINLAKNILKGFKEGNKGNYLSEQINGLSLTKAKQTIIVLEKASKVQLEEIRNKTATISSIYSKISGKHKGIFQDAGLLISAGNLLEGYLKGYRQGNKSKYLTEKIDGLSLAKTKKIMTVLQKASEEDLALIKDGRLTINSTYQKYKKMKVRKSMLTREL